MSDKEEAPKKKRKGKKFLIASVLVLLLGGGGVGATLYAGNPGLLLSRYASAGPDRPQLVPRNGVSDAEAARYFSPTGEKRPDPGKFLASYYPLEEKFTANLGEGDSFAQIGLGVSTYYDERVFENVKLHEMAVRSAILLTLSEQDPAALSTPKGKEGLKASLRQSVNQVLKSKEGFGGIDDVYFTSFVIQ
jgi:flagellar FliL protein